MTKLLNYFPENSLDFSLFGSLTPISCLEMTHQRQRESALPNFDFGAISILLDHYWLWFSGLDSGWAKVIVKRRELLVLNLIKLQIFAKSLELLFLSLILLVYPPRSPQLILERPLPLDLFLYMIFQILGKISSWKPLILASWLSFLSTAQSSCQLEYQ